MKDEMFGIEIFEREVISYQGINCVAVTGAVFTLEFATDFFVALSTRKHRLYKLQVDDHRALPHILNNIHSSEE